MRKRSILVADFFGTVKERGIAAYVRDLTAIAERMGYPLFMKPYDGGAWVGVTMIRDAEELQRAYDASGQRLMHLQKAVAGYDVFARSLSIGPETMVMKFDPDQPMHGRYSVAHGFLDAATGEVRLVVVGELGHRVRLRPGRAHRGLRRRRRPGAGRACTAKRPERSGGRRGAAILLREEWAQPRGK